MTKDHSRIKIWTAVILLVTVCLAGCGGRAQSAAPSAGDTASGEAAGGLKELEGILDDWDQSARSASDGESLTDALGAVTGNEEEETAEKKPVSESRPAAEPEEEPAEAVFEEELPETSVYDDVSGTLHILCRDESARELFAAYCPGYQKGSGAEDTVGKLTVRWTVVPDRDQYEQQLETLASGGAGQDDAADLFLVDREEAGRLAASGLAAPVGELGFTEEELSRQYDCMRAYISDEGGVQRGLGWQCEPGVLIYRRDIAKQVLGSDAPEKVQEAVSDWDAFRETAAKMKAAGYRMTATVFDPYGAYTGSETNGWVRDGQVAVDEQAEAWKEQAEQMLADGQTTAGEMWGSEWTDGLYTGGNVFCYFGPDWMIRERMAAEEPGSVAAAGGWAVCEGPQSYLWDGSWFCAAKGSGAMEQAGAFLHRVLRPEVLEAAVQSETICVNDKAVMEQARGQEEPALGGQQAAAVFGRAAARIRAGKPTYCGMVCADEYQSVMTLYFQKILTYEEAVSFYEEAVTEQFPELAEKEQTD